MAGLLVIMIGLTALLGWLLEIQALVRIGSTRTPMRPITAVGLVLLGGAILLLQEPRCARWRKTTGGIFAALAVALGATILLDHLLGFDVGIDMLLFPEALAELPQENPGRPSEITSISTVVAGLGLLALASRRRWALLAPQAAGLLILVLTFPMLIGALYGVEAFYAFAGVESTSLNTAVALVILGVGLLLVRPHHGPVTLLVGDDLGARVARRLVPIAVLVPLALGWLDLLAQGAGLLDWQVATAALVLTLVVVLVAIILWTGIQIRSLDAERRRLLDAERTARLAENRARREIEAIHESMIIGIYGLDLEGRATMINTAGARMLGYEPREILFEKMHDLVHHADKEGRHIAIEDCPIYLAFRANEVVRIKDDVLWRKDGTSFPVEYSSSPIRDERGTVVGAVVTFEDISERKRAEEELLRAHALIDGIASGTEDMIAAEDFEYCYTYINEAYRREFRDLWGRDIEVGTNMLEAMAPWPEELRKAKEQWSRALNGESFEISLEFGPPGRRKQVYDFRFNPIVDSNGRRIGASHILRNVTERARLQGSLHFLSTASVELAATLDLSESLRRVTQLAAPSLADYCVVYLIDAETKEIRPMEMACGDSEMETLARGQLYRHRINPDSNHPVADVLRTGRARLVSDVGAMFGGVTASSDHPSILCDFEPASAAIAPLLVHGRTLGAMSLVSSADSGRVLDDADLDLVRQLSDRIALAVDNANLYDETKRRADEEAALREAIAAVTDAHTIQEATRRIAETALSSTGSDGAFVERIDADLRHVEVVAVAGKVVPSLGARLPLHQSYAEDVLEKSAPRIVKRISEGGRLLPDDMAHTHGDCTAAIMPLARAGMALGVLILLRTPERQPFHADELERARTFVGLAALAFRKVFLLTESERGRIELQRVMASRERMMRGFSHDLKNPLGAADGQLQFLELGGRGELTPQQKESSSRARGSIRRALRLIDDLAELARAEVEEIESESLPVDVREIARETAEEHRAHAEAKGLRLDIDLPAALPPIDSDGARIRQILGNLISNAIKFTESGFIEVRVAEREASAPGAPRLSGAGPSVVVEVIDSGPGIPEDKRDLVFEEFIRLHPSSVPGTGIGLAISRRVAKALGGEITLGGEPGKGSMFTLWLPSPSTSPRPRPDRPSLEA